MTRILILYGTTEGQTAKIAEFIAEVIRGHGDEVTAVDVREVQDTIPDGYQGLIVGASIHMGKHDKHVVEFVRKTVPCSNGCRLRSSR
jgi:menaquinone-dependent protoporphyrinogen oxidase